MTCAPAATAVSSSRASTTSTNGSSPSALAAPTSSTSVAASTMRAMSRTASPPRSRASSTCLASITNSFASRGTALPAASRRARAAGRCSQLPSKYGPSHRTLTMEAPASAYARGHARPDPAPWRAGPRSGCEASPRRRGEAATPVRAAMHRRRRSAGDWTGHAGLRAESCDLARLLDSTISARSIHPDSADRARRAASRHRSRTASGFFSSRTRRALSAHARGPSPVVATSAAAALRTTASRASCGSPASIVSTTLAFVATSPPRSPTASTRAMPKSSGVTTISRTLPSRSSLTRVGAHGLTSASPSSPRTTHAPLVPRRASAPAATARSASS